MGQRASPECGSSVCRCLASWLRMVSLCAASSTPESFSSPSFLCLKNIRTFLGVCQQKFHLIKSELFEAFDLFDVRDFAKVLQLLVFPHPPSIRIELSNVIDTLSILSHSSIATQGRRLQPFPSEGCTPDDEIYSGLSDLIDDPVDGDDDLYECVEDEDNEGDEIYEDLMRRDEPPETVSETQIKRKVFDPQFHIQGPTSDLADTHRNLLEEVRSSILDNGAKNLHQVFLKYKERLLLYGRYCSQELMKHTPDPTDKDNLRTALDAMRDLAQCVNEVKRDNEIIRQITSFQLSIENMAMFICKKKSGETFELKEIIELQFYQIRDETAGEKDNKKWSYLFLLLDCNGRCGYDVFFKTRELKRKWLEQFEMALSNMCPDNASANNHDFQMHCFEETASCKACSMLLRGIFFQGYRCTRCKMAAHKECLGRVPNKTQRSSGHSSIGFPKMEVCEEYYGLPPPPAGFGQPLHLSKGDLVELTRADADMMWWEGSNLTAGHMGWFPSQKVQPYISVSTNSTRRQELQNKVL
ncbi:Proto-oncogene vav [Liparis tanakae]|uniref:Proto-oncogene vav n=1 Tax=Liparis tanakae TaxID=230148 RepID=A0A4Z2FR75_9TELE|nr:Proto-oncogene vav [Liparis tanakae]